jgi:hypothetical protein
MIELVCTNRKKKCVLIKVTSECLETRLQKIKFCFVKK